MAALVQQQCEEVRRLTDRIALLEKSERSLLTAKALLEAQLEQLRAAMAQLQDRSAVGHVVGFGVVGWSGGLGS